LTELLDLDEVLGQLTETLSTGWRQRAGLACAIVHEPPIVFLDEPTSGVDQAARQQFWDLIADLAAEGTTLLVTTHLMEEAEHCDTIGILDRGHLVATGEPDQLKQEVGGEVVEVTSQNATALARDFTRMFQIHPEVLSDRLRFESEDGHKLIPEIIESFPGQIESVTVRKPTLHDVFIHYTGHAFENGLAETETVLPGEAG